MSCGMNKEQESAWRLWHLLQELSTILWERYEPQFIERCIAEEDRRAMISSDAYGPDADPF